MIFLFFLLVLMVNAIKNNNIHLKKEYAAILSFAPMLRVHDIMVLPDNGGILTIDYTPINQSHPDVLLKLMMGKYVPAEVRIRRMAAWNLTEWYGLPSIAIHDIDNNVLKQQIIEIKKQWNQINHSRGMNLYKRNCKHFSNFVILYLQL